VNDAAAEGGDLGHCLVFGGSGFLGSNLARALIARGSRVRVFDLRAPAEAIPGTEVILGDVGDADAVAKACQGIDTVFNTAAILDFSRYPKAAQRERSERVNVRGVENVIAGSRAHGVKRLVHTSTNNVTLDGPVVDGDETWPYAEGAPDLYTQTKIRGEKAVLAANGVGELRTCAIRPGGIYGPGDELLLGAFVENVVRGRFVVVIGDGAALSDNSYIENLVAGEIAAACALYEGSPACGQAYFISDGEPLNYFEFFRPLAAALETPFPTRHIPGGPVYAAVLAWEWLGRWLPLPGAGFSSLEIKKLVVTHYSRIAKAERDFGWKPHIDSAEAAQRCIPWVRELARRAEQAG
jgi:3beta-hydroxy-delta5-steroid dehydrogenase/steroid delta-isomerase